MGISKEAENIMNDRFGKDSVISLATCMDNMPAVRYVNAYYDHNAFYVLTYALSNKMKHIENNPNVAIAGDWFTASGKGENLGYFGREENKAVADKMKTVFAEWINNGHNNFADENTIILKINLTEGVLFAHGTRYDIEY
mgnify:CR=1 FL=1